ncbi:hypothetical protein V6Z11_A05G097100 [Gossypium hirsutum]
MQNYQAIVTITSAKFARICKDLASIGDTVAVDIPVTKEGLRFNQRRFSGQTPL